MKLPCWTAATPSNAAELAVPDQDALRQSLDAAYGTLVVSMRKQLDSARRHLRILSDSSTLQSPVKYVIQRRQALEHLQSRLISNQQRAISAKQQRFVSLTAKLDAMSPLKVLARGFSVVQDEDNRILRSVRGVEAGDRVQGILSDGEFDATVVDIKENKA